MENTPKQPTPSQPAQTRARSSQDVFLMRYNTRPLNSQNRERDEEERCFVRSCN